MLLELCGLDRMHCKRTPSGACAELAGASRRETGLGSAVPHTRVYHLSHSFTGVHNTSKDTPLCLSIRISNGSQCAVWN